MAIKEFDCVIIDTKEKTFTILDGSVGTYKIEEIEKIQVLGEKASKKGKTDPFTYMVLTTGHASNSLFEPSFYLGLKIDMKDHTTLAIYLHTKKTYSSTDIYRKAKEKGEKIRTILYKYKEL